jgi:hypothetical protein
MIVNVIVVLFKRKPSGYCSFDSFSVHSRLLNLLD